MKQKLTLKQRTEFTDRKNEAIKKIGKNYAIILKWKYPELRMCDIYAFKHQNSYDQGMMDKVLKLAKNCN